MVYQTQRSTNNIYGSVRSNKIIEGQDISSFLGHETAAGSNVLDFKLGELIYNKNMEWRFSGNSKFLRTKRGSTLYKDIVVGVKGAGVFIDSSVNYVVWVDTNGNLKYRKADGSIEILKTGLDTTYRHEFWYYGLADNETLYGCNRTNGIYKVTMIADPLDATTDIPTYSSVLSTTGAWSMTFSNISGRLIFTNGHKALYGKVQNQTSTDTTNLEDFDITNQTTWVFPDQGTGIQRVVDNGEITFFFKDTGIWALINAEEDIATWLQPKCNADVGTKSPDTIQYVKYGDSEVYIYLGTDKTLRIFTAQVERNSGATPTLKGGDSLVISGPFQDLLDDIPDDYIDLCNGYAVDGKYILNIVSIGGTTINTTIVVDLDKLMDYRESDEINQPYFFYTDNMEYSHYIKLDNLNSYGFHNSGYISKLFVNDKYYEEVPDRVTPIQAYQDYITVSGVTGTFVSRETITGGTSGNTATTTIDLSDTTLLVKDISSGGWTVGETVTGGTSSATATVVSIVRRAAIEWAAYTGWHKFSGRELQLYDAYLNWSVGGGRYAINFTVNSFLTGEAIPSYLGGRAFSLKPQSVGGAYFDVSYFNQSYFDSGSGQLSQNTGGEGRGNYFSFGFYSNNYNEWASVYSIEPRFEVIKNDSIGRNF